MQSVVNREARKTAVSLEQITHLQECARTTNDFVNDDSIYVFHKHYGEINEVSAGLRSDLLNEPVASFTVQGLV